VLTRTGYALGETPTPADRRRAIDTALAAPFTQQALRIEYTTYAGPSITAGQQRIVLSLVAELPVAPARAPGAGRTGTASDDSADDRADVVFAVRDVRTARTVASGSDRLPLPDHTSGAWSTGRAPWHIAFDLPAGEYIMRCVVREPGGIVGSADRRFGVRALHGPDVTTSDLIIASPDEPLPVRARAYADDRLTGTLRVYGPTAAGLEATTAHLELTAAADETGTEPRVSVATLGEVVTSGSHVMRDVLFAMPLEGLTAGPYVARAVVRVNGEVVADLRRPVEVVLGTAPAAASAARPDRARASNVLDGEIARRLSQRAAEMPTDEVRRGLAELSSERYALAASLLALAFEAHPDDAALAFVLGWAHVGAGNRTAAVTAFRNAALREPTMVPAHLALADTYVALGHPALAIQALEAGLKAVPASGELARMLASLKK
jgi:hypothetical protein